MFHNPEFKRNLWLELSSHRLIAAPAFLALLFTSVANFGDGIGIGLMAITIFSVVTILWGTHLAFDSVAEEVRNRTWDSQIMSSLSPSKMFWGKLFGATAFTWYVGLPCLVILAMSDSTKLLTNISIFNLLILLLFTAVFAHAMGLLFGLIGAKANIKLPKTIGIIFLLFSLTTIYGLLFKSNQEHMMVWYGQSYVLVCFQEVSLIIFTAWMLLACYRTMQSALQIKLKPWAMLIFVIFCTLYLLGIDEIYSQLPYQNYFYNLANMAAVLAIAATYVGVITEKRDLLSIHRFVHAWKACRSTEMMNINRALKETPFFLVLLILAFFLVLITTLIQDSEFMYNQQLTIINSWQLFGLVGMIAFVLLLRDVGLLYCLSLGAKPERALITTMFYLIALYSLLPIFFPYSIGFLFNPLLYLKAGYTFYVALMMALLHLIVVMGLLYLQHKSSISNTNKHFDELV